MPTAAKLFAAVAFAIIAFFTAEVFKPAMPEGTAFGPFSFVCAFFGLLCGWLLMGGLAGHGMVQAAGSGIRTSLTTLFFVLIFFSIYEMVLLSMKLRYDGPTQAILGAFDLAGGYIKKMGRTDFLLVLLGGGALGGMLTEWANRRWK